MRVLLVTPPFMQINSPYPASAYLVGHLRAQGIEAVQHDLGVSVVRRLFSRAGLAHVFACLEQIKSGGRGNREAKAKRERREYFLSARTHYLETVESVLDFLKGQDDTLALRIVTRHWLPEGPRFIRFQENSEILSQFGRLGVRDQARHLASLYLDDLVDLIRENLDPHFSLANYGESLASSQPSFTPLYEQLKAGDGFFDLWIRDEMESLLNQHHPDLVGFTCPFPGNLYGALRAAEVVRSRGTPAVLGGGFVNTELRQLEDVRFFEFIDFVCYDDGERPLEQLISYLREQKRGSKEASQLCRTKRLVANQVVSEGFGDSQKQVMFKEHPGPNFSGLDFSLYFGMIEMANPMHRLWSDFRWNKMILAHGCYWKRCSFCDTSLDYIRRFEPAKAENLIEQMKRIAKQTGSRGFHFVDEAAPPALLRTLSERLIADQSSFVWWGNLRFDKQFDPGLTATMAEAGCVAVTGGLEVASARVLKLINKGVTIEDAARVTANFSRAKIMVHAYLMYGFPTQTEQETVDSLEVVRQLFQSGCLQSAYWHRFLLTEHAPALKHADEWGVTVQRPLRPPEGWFARNTLEYSEATGVDHDRLGEGLRRATYNYMHGIGLDSDVREWFDISVPKAKVKKGFISAAIKSI